MKKLFKRAVYVLLPIVILILVAILKWEPITYFALGKIVRFYGNRSHIVLEIGGMKGKPFTETTLDAVAIRPGETDPQTYGFKADTVTCTYNLWDLKIGYERFLAGLACRVDKPQFTYDFRGEALQDQAVGKHEQFQMPALLPRIEVHNGTVLLTHAEWDAEIRGINSSLGPAAAAHELRLAVENLRFRQGGATKIETGFRSLLRYSGAELSIDSFEVGAAEISATGTLDLSRLDKEDIGFAADVAFSGSRLNVSGAMENRLLQMHIKTENFDIGELQKRLGGEGWDISGRIRGEADLAYNLEQEPDIKGTVAFGVLEGRVHGVGIDALSLSGSFDNKIAYVAAAEAGTPGNRVIVSDLAVPVELLLEGDILAIMGAARAVFTADIKDVGTLLRLFGIGDKLMPQSARPDLFAVNGHLENGVVYLDGARAVKAGSSLVIDRMVMPVPSTVEAFESVQIDAAARFQSSSLQEIAGLFGDIPVSGQGAADMKIAGSMKEPRALISFAGENLVTKDLRIGDLALQAEVDILQEKLGQVKAIHFAVTEMTQTNDSGTLALVTPAAGVWQNDTFSLHGTVQVDGKGDIAIGITRKPEKEVVVEITTSNLDSDGWLGMFMDKRYFFHGADTETVIRGLPGNPYLELAGSIAEAGGTGVPFPLAGSFVLQYSAKGIEISEFTWKSHEKNQVTVSGYLPYDPLAQKPFLDGELTLNGHIDIPALEDIKGFLEPLGIDRGSVVLDMGITGSWTQPLGHIRFQAEGIELPETVKKYTGSPMKVSGDIAAQGDVIVLQSANLETAAYAVQGSGSWQHRFSVDELLQEHKFDLQGDVTGDATVQLKDLDFLRKNLPWLRRLEGDMQGKLHVSGPITEPAITGSFALKDGEASHTFNFPTFSAINLQGDFNEHSITINRMQAEVGGSPVNLSGNVNKEEEIIAVNLHVDGKNLLLFRNNDMRMRGDVQLDVSGPLEHLVIKGTTGLTGGYYTRNIDFLGKFGSSSVPVSEGVSFLFSFPDPPLKDATFDIRITTIEPFRIRNNLIRGILRPELSLKGTGELPFLVGTVYIDPSRVLLPSGRLQIQSGLIRFPAGEPDRPQLDLVAQSKVLGYDINVVTRGPLDDPEITLSSSPALPNDDLLLLLLTGQPPKQDLAGGGKNRGATNVMVYLGRDFLGKWLEDEPGASDETILDRFKLDFGRGVTKSGEQTVEASFRLSELETGKRMVYYLSGEKDRYDAYNYGLKLVFRFE